LDHDPVIATFEKRDYVLYLPLATKNQ